jgi:hypothetical protein
MRVLVCGGRTYDRWGELKRALDSVQPVSVIIHGNAPGADRLAGKWADTRGLQTIVFPPNWSLGKRGGPIRNKFMLDEGRPDLVVAFPGGFGTQNMVKLARESGVNVIDIGKTGDA